MKKLLYISLLTIFFVGCDDRLEELNTDKKNPASVDPTSLFTRGLRETADMVPSISVNDNTFNLYAQYWAQTTYPDESQYNLTGRSIPRSFWRNGYRSVLSNLKNAEDLIIEQKESGASGISDAVLNNRLAAIDILQAYVFTALVDAFGNIPYTEALDSDNLNPAYDDARSIYDSEIANLVAAVGNITTGAAGFPANQDPMYAGDMAKWQLFANSLRFKLGMRLADVDKASSISVANSALTAGVFGSNDDNAAMQYASASPSTSPIYEDLVLSGRKDFVAANTFVNKMNELNDPRRSVFFRDNLGGTYNGGVYGDANNYSAYTQVGDVFHDDPTLAGVLLSYSEILFLKAEAAARTGYGVNADASVYYNMAIEASFDKWGVDGFSAYIAQPNVAYSSTGDWKQQIGIQKWISLYARGYEAWNTWKMLDFVVFNAPPGLELTDLPLRLTYPLEEAQLNLDAYTKAGSAIGGDAIDTKVFWDRN